MVSSQEDGGDGAAVDNEGSGAWTSKNRQLAALTAGRSLQVRICPLDRSCPFLVLSLHGLRLDCILLHM